MCKYLSACLHSRWGETSPPSCTVCGWPGSSGTVPIAPTVSKGRHPAWARPNSPSPVVWELDASGRWFWNTERPCCSQPCVGHCAEKSGHDRPLRAYTKAVFRVDSWLASANLDFRRVPTIPRIDKRSLLYLFLNFILEIGEEREEDREKHWCEGETSFCCLLYTPWLGIKPATQPCALIRNGTSNLLVCRMMPNQLSHTGRDPRCFNRWYKYSGLCWTLAFLLGAWSFGTC